MSGLLSSLPFNAAPAPPRLRLRACQQGARHASAASVPRPQKYPAHGALLRTGTNAVQGFQAALTGRSHPHPRIASEGDNCGGSPTCIRACEQPRDIRLYREHHLYRAMAWLGEERPLRHRGRDRRLDVKMNLTADSNRWAAQWIGFGAQVASCSPPAHHRARHRHIIPIALAASQRPTARDFVPWRFLDAGSLSVRRVSLLPASKNVHNNGSVARPHSITSSAVESSLSGTERPSAFAVLRLITNSNVVGCSTGKSAGLAPRRILST